MKLAILGTGNIGGNLGTLLARAGHAVVFGSRNADASDLGTEPGVTVTTPEAAIASADVVIEALPFGLTMRLDPAALAGKILISASNYDAGRDGAIGVQPSESEALAARLPRTRVVKAFNVAYYKHFADRVATGSGADVALLVAADDNAARSVALTLVQDAGFDAVDAGALSNGVRFQRSAEFFNTNMSKAQIEARWPDRAI